MTSAESIVLRFFHCQVMGRGYGGGAVHVYRVVMILDMVLAFTRARDAWQEKSKQSNFSESVRDGKTHFMLARLSEMYI